MNGGVNIVNIKRKIYRFNVYTEDNDFKEYFKGILELIPVFNVEGFKEFRYELNGEKVEMSEVETFDLIKFHNDTEDEIFYGINPRTEHLEITGAKTPYEATRVYIDNELMIVKRISEED